MNQSHPLQNNTRLLSKPISSSKSSDAMDLIQQRRVHKHSVMHQSIEITKVYDVSLIPPTLAN